jgi:putative transposase
MGRWLLVDFPLFLTILLNMPRSARLDIIGALQHVMVRGIEKTDIFIDDSDRAFFVQRFSNLLQETETHCLAWSLMSNHFHLLLKPTEEKLSTFMRRLLTGYAVRFNLRHNRKGHLFQNRYKSIVCEEDPYLMELVRYIHLNPFRAGIVSDLDALDRYPWTGHSILMGAGTLKGQNTVEVLSYFGKGSKAARESYRGFVMDGVNLGKRDELVGGGLRRSLKAGLKEGERSFDERILGSGDFVESLLGNQQRGTTQTAVVSLPELVRQVGEVFGVSSEDIRAPGRSKPVVNARSAVSYIAYRKMGYSGEEIAPFLGITRSGVCRRAATGEELFRLEKRLQKLLHAGSVLPFYQQVTSVP